MANVLGDLFSDIANAIRSKTGETGKMKPIEFPEKIAAIQAGGGGGSGDVRYVTFLSHDGTVILGIKAVAVGDDCADPVDRGLFETPTRESTAQNTYTFAGWATVANGAASANALKTVTEDRTVYAAYTASVRKYTITYYDGDTLLKSEQVAYGVIPSYTPTKDGYDFDTWVPAVVAVTGDASYTAKWKTKATFATAPWAQIIEVAQSGNAASTFAIGDERTETINYTDGTSENITWIIVSLNHTVRCSDGNKDNVTIAAKHALSKKQSMYTGATLSGNYENSKISAYLNDTFYNSLPADLKSGIKDALLVNDVPKKVWIPALVDLGLSDNNYTSGYPGTGPFEYYNTTDKRIVTLGADGSAVEYWTRSLYNSGSYTYFATISTSGAKQTGKGLTNAFAVVPCFCI